jgi:oligoendopeptidase F
MARRKSRSGIKIKKSNQGKLRKATGTKKGQKIPVAQLQKMKKSKNPLARKRATFALNARGWKNRGRKKK